MDLCDGKGHSATTGEASGTRAFSLHGMYPFSTYFSGSRIGRSIPASDSSSTGGAVGIAKELTPQGMDLVAVSMDPRRPKTAPILVVSLFNGIGGALRCYDILGLLPVGIICFDIHQPAQRTTSKRWPHAEVCGDVKQIDKEMVASWFRRYIPLREVHIWAGFPCTDLSSVRAGRLGLEGPASGLLLEGVMTGLAFAKERHWTTVTASAKYPESSQLVEDDAWWPGRDYGHVLPTAMKSIKRVKPPEKPAGYARCDWDTLQRWSGDSYRFPPYHYQERFIFWVGDKWRRCSPSEKEILFG